MSTTRSTTQTRRTPISPVVEGDVVDGKYRIERTLAAGGMGVIVCAKHLVLEQPVALKFLIPHVQDDQLVARFLREARAAARIQSPHSVRVFDCGTLPSGEPYMAMELLEGCELGHELRTRGPLPVEEAVDIVLAALEGLAAAHALGIVHRDLKPSNLFLASHGRARTVKVLDFGISKPLGGPDSPIDDELTGTAVMLGSPRYASPEQAQSSRDVDVRTDIWSMGVVLYELLDGKCPFGGGSMGEVLGKVLLFRPPPVSAKRPEVPAGLDAVLSRCIVRDRDARYQDAAQMAAALAPFASTRGKMHAERVAGILGTSIEDASAATPAAKAPDADAPESVLAAALGTPPPPRAESLSDAALTNVQPAMKRAPASPTGGDVVLPPPAADPPASSIVGDATVGTFARTGRTQRSRLGLFAVVIGVGLVGALATFLAMSGKPATPGVEPSSQAAAREAAASSPASLPIAPPSVARGIESSAVATTSPSARAAPPSSASAASAPAVTSVGPPRPGPRPHPAAPKTGVLDRSD